MKIQVEAIASDRKFIYPYLVREHEEYENFWSQVDRVRESISRDKKKSAAPTTVSPVQRQGVDAVARGGGDARGRLSAGEDDSIGIFAEREVQKLERLAISRKKHGGKIRNVPPAGIEGREGRYQLCN